MAHNHQKEKGASGMEDPQFIACYEQVEEHKQTNIVRSVFTSDMFALEIAQKPPTFFLVHCHENDT